MKNIIKLLFICTLLLCITCTDGFIAWYNFTFDKVHFKNVLDATEYVHDTIKYDYAKYEAVARGDLSHYYWQTPTETLNTEKGTCADMCVLLAAIVKYQFNKEGDIYVFPIDAGYHCVVRIDHVYYDPSIGEIWEELPSKVSYIVYFSQIPYKLERLKF